MGRWFQKRAARRATEAAARRIYDAAVAQARRPEFYRDFGVPDTVDGRFDMVALHVALLLRRLRAASEGERGRALAQAVFDAFFADMDASLRELGVGDLGVGRQIKTMATQFYGRLASYDDGLDGDPKALVAAIARNIYRKADPAAARAAALGEYVRAADGGLAAAGTEAILAGAPFPEPRVGKVLA